MTLSERLSERIKKKMESLSLLQKNVTEMEEGLKQQREKKKRDKSRKDICLCMDTYILPFLEGVANTFNEPLTEGVKRLIKEGKNPFKPKKGWNRTKDTEYILKRFMDSPTTKILQTMAKPYIRYKMEWIHEEAEWIREQILKDEYPDLYEAIMETEGGKEWLDDLINSFISTIKGYIGR